MSIRKKTVLIIILMAFICTLAGCQDNSTVDDKADLDQNNDHGITYEQKYGIYIIIGYDVEHMEYIPPNKAISDRTTGWTYMGELYYVNPYILGDYFKGKLTEGGACWTDSSKENIRYGFTVDEGRGGAVAGPTVEVILDLANNEIVESTFTGFETQPFTDVDMVEMGNILARILEAVEKYCEENDGS